MYNDYITKIPERLIFNRCVDHLENILNEKQFGFRKNHSTYMAIIELIDVINNAVEKRKITLALYLDLPTKIWSLCVGVSGCTFCHALRYWAKTWHGGRHVCTGIRRELTTMSYKMQQWASRALRLHTQHAAQTNLDQARAVRALHNKSPHWTDSLLV